MTSNAKERDPSAVSVFSKELRFHINGLHVLCFSRQTFEVIVTSSPDFVILVSCNRHLKNVITFSSPITFAACHQQHIVVRHQSITRISIEQLQALAMPKVRRS